MKVFLLTTGSGFDGDEWGVLSIHSTREGAEQARKEYERPVKRVDGTSYSRDSEIEEWELEE